jgi:hypothetical protein
MNRPAHSLVTLGVAVVLAVLVAVLLTACQGAPRASRVVQLEPLNDSGVTGSVTLVDAGEGRTQVQVRVEPAGNLDMPAHIHPGSCDNLIPQPKHPLENVVNGVSTTIVRASLAELTQGGLAVNLHKSNQDLKTYTACAEL